MTFDFVILPSENVYKMENGEKVKVELQEKVEVAFIDSDNETYNLFKAKDGTLYVVKF